MAKVQIQTIANLDNPPTVVSQMNANFVALQTVIDTLLSRDGAVPNSMLALLDMNANRIINLPVPVSPTEPARHGDIQQYVDQAQQAADDAAASALAAQNAEDAALLSAAAALASQIAAEIARVAAEAALAEFEIRYQGVLPSAPSIIPGPGQDHYTFQGTLYYDSTLSLWRVYVVDGVLVGVDDVIAGTDGVVVADWVSFQSTDGSGVLSDTVDFIVTLTLTEYEALVPQARTLYFVTDDT